MVGMTSCMLFICYKMFPYAPVVEFFMTWFNMAMFNTYCMKRKHDNMSSERFARCCMR